MLRQIWGKEKEKELANNFLSGWRRDGHVTVTESTENSYAHFDNLNDIRTETSEVFENFLSESEERVRKTQAKGSEGAFRGDSQCALSGGIHFGMRRMSGFLHKRSCRQSRRMGTRIRETTRDRNRRRVDERADQGRREDQVKCIIWKTNREKKL